MNKQRKKPTSMELLPAQQQEDLLPSETIPEDRFENACLALARLEEPKLRPELKEVRGAKQYEVDVECFDSAGEPRVVIQCKRYDKVSPSKYIGWVKAFIEQLEGHWKERDVKTYVLAVTIEGNRENIKEKVREAARLLKLHGIEFRPWFKAHLTYLFQQDANIVRQFFHEAWTDAISANQPVAPASAQGNISIDTTVGHSVLSEVVALTNQVDSEISATLDRLEDEAKAGRPDNLRRYLDEKRFASTAWQRLTATTQARILRRSSLFAVDDGDVGQAEALFEEAKLLASPRDQIVEAHITYRRVGLHAAIKFLSGTTHDNEKELLTALLIADQQLDEAGQVLSTLPETAERERLNALLSLQVNERSRAIAHAERAIELKPGSYSPKLVALLAHFNSALIDGEKIEFATAPNPFETLIVRSDDKARTHLNSALALVDGLLETSAGVLRSDLEVWKFVLLHCHPARRSEVASYAKSVLESPYPSPMFIVWALSLGLDLQTGKLRKYLEDEIRLGRGSATNVVVAALLEKDVDGTPDKSIKLIDKYLSKWPEAEEFLQTWRDQLAGDDALIVAVEKHKSDDFDGLVDEALAKENDQKFLLSATQTLKMRRAYQQILKLEDRLLNICNAPAILALAEARISCGLPEAAAELLEKHKDVFGGDQLPIAALQLAAAAADQAGKAGATLEALQRLEERAPTAENQIQILQRAVSLNNKPAILKYGRKLQDQEHVEGYGRLMAAHVVGPHDPTLARSLLEKHIVADNPDAAAVPGILQLKGIYGLKDAAAEEVFGLLFTTAIEEGEHLVRFDDVADLIKHIEEQDEARRELRERWLQGFASTHQAFASDVPAFLEQYLSEARSIKTFSGDEYPRIIEAAGLPSRDLQPIANADKPTLIIDVSALLLLTRFKLLPAVSNVFNCCVVRLLIPALDHFVDELQRAKPFESSQIVDKLEAARELITPLVAAKEPEIGETPISRPQNGQQPSTELENFIDQLERSGGDENGITELRRLTGVTKELPAQSQSAPRTYRIDSGIAFCLVHSELLANAVDALELRIDPQTFDSLFQNCVRHKALDNLEQSVKEARDFVAERLATNEWREWSSSTEQPQEDEVNQGLTVLSMVSSMSAVTDPGKPTIVIADRFVQRHRFPTIIHFSDLLELLVLRSGVTRLISDGVKRTLLEEGTGFFSLSADEIVRALKLAALNHGAIIETARIRELRTNFAKQARLMHCVDWTENRQVDGAMIGDPKHVIDTAFLASAVIENAWTDDAIPLEKKIAISDWAWCFLRLENLSGNVPDLSEEQRYVHNLALVFIKLVNWPYLNQFSENKFENWQELQPYIDWLFGTVLNPRFKAAPEVLDRFINEYVRLAVKHGEILAEGEAERDRKLLSAFVAKQQRAFIALFPDDVRDRLISRPEFAKLAGLSRNFTIKIGDSQVPVPEISSSIGEAFKASDRKTKLESVAASLSVSAGDKPDTFEVMIEKDGNAVRLATETVAMLHPLKAARLASFKQVADDLGTTTEVQAEFEKAHSSEGNANERVRLYNEAREKDFCFAEAHLLDLIGERGELIDDCFSLPDPSALASYMRIDIHSSDAATAVLAQGYEALKSDLGLEIADRRYAACPIQFEKSESFHDDLPSRGDSLFLFSNALAAGATQPNPDKQAISVQWQRLNEVYGWQVGLFAFLIRRGAETAATSQAWAGIEESLVLAMLWVWADRLSATFSNRQVDIAPILETLEARSERTLDLVLDGRHPATPLEVFGRELVEEKVGLNVLGKVVNALEFLPSDQRKSVLEWIGVWGDDESEWMLCPSLLFEDLSETAPLIKTLEIGVPAFLALVPQPDQWMGFNQPDLIKDSIKKLEEATNLDELRLIALARPEHLSKSQKVKIWDCLQVQIVQSSFDFSKTAHQVWLTFFARVSAHLKRGDEFIDCLKVVASRHAGSDSSTYVTLDGEPEPGTSEFAYSSLVEGVAAYVRASDVPLETKGALLCRKLRMISAVWRATEISTLLLISKMFGRTPTGMAALGWGCFLEARSR